MTAILYHFVKILVGWRAFDFSKCSIFANFILALFDAADCAQLLQAKDLPLLLLHLTK